MNNFGKKLFKDIWVYSSQLEGSSQTELLLLVHKNSPVYQKLVITKQWEALKIDENSLIFVM